MTKHHRNLAVHAGDKIYVRIDAQTSGPRAWREATLWFVNETTGDYLPPRTFHSGCVDCGTPFQRPAMLYGNTAEWIVEATFYSADRRSLPNTLDDFGTVRMSHVFTTDQDGVTYDLTNAHRARSNIDWITERRPVIGKGHAVGLQLYRGVPGSDVRARPLRHRNAWPARRPDPKTGELPALTLLP